MENKIKYLKESPIYAMSLCSKELFHSNFWAWLMEQDESFIEIFFKNEGNKQLAGIGREDGNRDVTVYRKSNEDNDKEKVDVYVIENKLKSIPTVEQLKKYKVDVQKWGIWKGGVLTGVKKPLFEMPDGWSFLSHREIAQKIRNTAKNSSKETIKGNIDLINEYCEVLELICDLLEYKLEATKNVFEYNVDGLAEIRISDIAKKMKAEDFLAYLNNYLKARETELPQEYNDFCLKTYVSFNNGKATIDARYSNWKDKKTTETWLCVGVQIEGYQYRHMAERDKKGYSLDTIYNEFKENGWFDDEYDKYEKREIFNRPTTMKPHKDKKYNKYEGGEYNFVYQYYDLYKQCEEDKKEYYSYEEVCKFIYDDLKKVLDYINKGKI